MSSEISEDQLVHYFADECSEEEAARIETWINADPDRKRRVARLRRIWDAAKSRAKGDRDVNAMWNDLARRLQSFEDNEPQLTRESIDEWGSQKKDGDWSVPALVSRSYGVFAVTVSIIVLGFAALVLYSGGVIDRGDSSMRTIATDVGQRASVELGDGSEAVLNADSKLELPPVFGEEKREVTLVGEAYFKVVPEQRPFLVHAEGSVTRVLGTEFGVDAYPEDDKVRVVVLEGEVAVRSEDERLESSVALTDRQMASLSKVNDLVLRREVDPSLYVAWMEGKLVFNDASFEEVARQLESWYGLEVELVGSVENTDRLNATYSDEPVGEVLSIIAGALDLRYERDGNTVTFFVEDGVEQRPDGRR